MFEQMSHSLVTRAERLDKNEFVSKHLRPAVPVVISKLGERWPATEKWNTAYLSRIAGDNKVPVYSSQPAQGTAHQHAAVQTLALRDYLQKLENGEQDLRIFFYNILNEAPELLNDFSYPDMGMKFFKRLPVLFAAGRGAKVQMHYDIDLANLVLCHFGGPKHVFLVSPEQTRYLYKVPFSFSTLHAIDPAAPDFERFPALRKVHGEVAVLNHGDCLFIPSGYWHYIVYEDIGFSMTLRSMPTDLVSRLQVLKNIALTRNVEGTMRKLLGQRWNDRNERLAIELTHQYI